MSHVYCSSCGFQNPESANYCSKCGSLLAKEEAGDSTMTFTAVTGDDEGAAPALEEVGVKGPALVVRSGGGRSGETFVPDAGETTIGRSPDCGVFLDDVTVSRRHAVLRGGGDGYTIEDLGSLNGTYVNRNRIDGPTRLRDGDELQIGKYRLSFLAR